jgi:hypothetical protein
MHGLDHRALRVLADDRTELLRHEMTRPARPRRGTARVRLGFWLVGVGFRVAGPCAGPPPELAST